MQWFTGEQMLIAVCMYKMLLHYLSVTVANLTGKEGDFVFKQVVFAHTHSLSYLNTHHQIQNT